MLNDTDKHQVEASVQPGSVDTKKTHHDAVETAQRRYDEERNKRIRTDGIAQYMDLYAHEKFQSFQADPWVEIDTEQLGHRQLQDGSRSEILIIGTGYAGLLFAVRLLQAGFRLQDLRMVDSAGGFGGTWYWNRYPGLMCDVESYIYMPLLEETGYVPTMKYTSGQELKEHADRIATKWGLDKATWFRQRVNSIAFDDEKSEWVTSITPQQGSGQEGSAIRIRSRFTIMATGFTLIPQIPRIPGIEKFKGHCFHTARWDYKVTGGTPDNPEMAKLKDMRVGIIGTGATAIQAVPALAPWAEELLVFQRTPSAVDWRGNKPTDPEWARKTFSKPGWQAERSNNFHLFTVGAAEKPVDMVNDGWTRMDAYHALAGTPNADCSSPEKIQEHVSRLHELDLPRQAAIRKRVDEVVQDPVKAQLLKPWYPGWCKRPCFHDEYLKAFNEPNVSLVDTNGLGVERITEDGLVVAGKEYKVDTLILSTGYRSPVLFSPCGRVDIDVRGRNGLSLDEKWNKGVATLHGMMSHDFPNFFWPGLNQAAGSPNFVFCINNAAVHVSKVMAHAARVSSAVKESSSSGRYRHNFTVEPSVAAEEEWAERVVMQAGTLAAGSGCTPSYFNAEGEFDRHVPPEVLKKRARGAIWGKGPLDFVKVIEDWRDSKGYPGLEIVALDTDDAA
ncbi:hypothetical protein F66182_4140 [Fusarium sp. NRRL 66182]|nr:hypothetical protein F66182_4140 [Fusarium sp. NRRL 66182]